MIRRQKLMILMGLPAACDLGFDGCFSFLEARICLFFSLFVAFSFFLFLLAFFTLNSSSSLSDGSLKSSSLSESAKALLLL